MRAEEVQATVQVRIRYPESQARLFLQSPRWVRNAFPLTPRIYAEVNSSGPLTTLSSREAGLLKCLQPNLNLSGMAVLNTRGMLFPPPSFSPPKENHIIYSSLSRQRCGRDANGEAAWDTQLADRRTSGKWCSSVRTNAAAQ